MYQEWFKDYERIINKECKCCSEIEFLKDLEKSRKPIPNITHKLKARLTSISKRKGIRKEVGVINYKAYDLNYCPMCRTKISRRWTKRK